ncbi:MAG: glycerol-3-phosphate dehydrogenase/oxidase [Euryarchaeota archaeon]|nr:glycerol-3-phosphate dehydrogenase/oxidase [Euryarchaeota archaeon]
MPPAPVPSEEAPRDAREACWRELVGRSFDLLVVGGGITAAGIASEAAARGAEVALIEREDFGSGTSGATSKMLHGGLRYLQHGKIGLVKEALHERGLLVRSLGEQRVQVTPFLLPLDGTLGHRLSLRFGTWLYQRLCGPLALGPRRLLSVEQVRGRVPFLETKGVRGGVLYFEGVVDDTLLTLVRVGEAVRRGAVAVNHVEALAPLLDAGRITGVKVRDRLSGRTGEVRAKRVINATGVWSPRWAGTERTPRLRPSKGVHLVFRKDRLPLDVAVVLAAPEGRWVFALPYGHLAIIGTTDTDFPGDPDRVRAEADDVGYLLEVAQKNFPTLHLTAEDVVDVYAGLRPLLAGGAERPGDLSREDVVHTDASGLLSVAGGKLTTHRAMAERALERAKLPTPGIPKGGTPTKGGSSWSSWSYPPRWERTPCPGALAFAEALGSTSTPTNPSSPSPEARLTPWVDAAVRVAGAATLSDLIDRRFHTLQRLDPGFERLVEDVARLAQPLLGWTDEQRVREREDYLSRVHFETEAVLALRRTPRTST